MIFAISALPLPHRARLVRRPRPGVPGHRRRGQPVPAAYRPQPAAALQGTSGLVRLLVTAAAYLAAGIPAFRLGERTARTRGTLARYRARDGAPGTQPSRQSCTHAAHLPPRLTYPGRRGGRPMPGAG